MYKDYFGFKESPFSIAPDPRYLYMSQQHREALAHLLFGVRSDGGFVLLTGEVGTGKTTVCRCLLEQLPEDVDVAFIFNPTLTVEELLSTICDELHISYPGGNKSLKVFLDLLNAYLLDAHSRGRNTLLIIDEAQNLPQDVLEQIRLLTNLETNQRKLLHIILLGQTELLEMLALPKLRQLSQRVIARYHLRSLSKKDVGAYVAHRLTIAGTHVQLFPESTISRLYHLSRGIPRLINVICDRALLGVYVQGKHKADKKILDRAAREVSGEDSPPKGFSRAFPRWAIPGVVLLGVCALVMAAHFKTTEKAIVAEAPSAKDPERENPAVLHRRPIPAFERPMKTEQVAAGQNQATTPHKEKEEPAAPPSTPSMTAEKESVAVQQTSLAESGLPGAGVEPVRSRSMKWMEKLSGFQNAGPAFLTLFKIWGTDVKSLDPEKACGEAESRKLRCLTSHGDLEELRSLNLPVVLKLYDTRGNTYSMALTHLKEGEAILRAGNETVNISIEEMAASWRGEYTLLWRAPPDYRGNIKEGNTGPIVKWVAAKLARIQGKKDVVRKDPVFDEELVESVKEFQRSKGIRADGVVGPKTFICLITETSSNIPVLASKKKDG